MWVLGKGGRGRAAALALVAGIAGIADLAVADHAVAAVGAEVLPGGPPAAGTERRVDLEQLLTNAGFGDAVPMSEEELRQAGEHFAAGWTAPAGDLVGLLFVVPADEPRATIGAFLEQLGRSCRGRFAATSERIEAAEGRTIGRANAACHGKSRSLHYDMIFRFAASGTLGIVHIAFDAAARRASEITAGLAEILAGW